MKVSDLMCFQFAVPWAHILADITSENTVKKLFLILRRNLITMFYGEVGNTFPGIHVLSG